MHQKKKKKKKKKRNTRCRRWLFIRISLITYTIGEDIWFKDQRDLYIFKQKKMRRRIGKKTQEFSGLRGLATFSLVHVRAHATLISNYVSYKFYPTFLQYFDVTSPVKSWYILVHFLFIVVYFGPSSPLRWFFRRRGLCRKRSYFIDNHVTFLT